MSTLEKPASEEGRLIRRPGPRETRPESAHRRRRALELSLAVAVPVVLVLLWQLAATQEWIDERVYPAPSAILSDGWERAVEGELWPDVWATLKRVLAGYAIGTVSGYLLGLLMGALPLVRAALEPMMDALYVVPKLALLPIFLNMFGLGEGPQIALVAATVFFFVWISTMAAVLAVPEGHRDAGAVFGAGHWQMFRHVLLPASLPSVLVGARIAAGVAVLVIVASESIAASDGLGHLIFDSRALFQNDVMFVGIVCVAVLGVIFSELVRIAGRVLTPWAPRDRGRGQS
ncbi:MULTISPECIES: ABC transporter permease [unclassified Streptomyces]|uniref:ABC transporter permease n=1 Tax=unclassified Streptomyces TaxID=2593676 RepID=UPI002DD7BAE3|nr:MULTISPECIES: ABC transporter permease [unclassified Streptomyces]WSA92478.1 ABC transporter permease [Streptomyces sp. NBC_01795]WSB76844.1 ABC transporter permease [Streptomyces sp. NBC_01775]WSS14882.1 ABC transporter permease [Streptomyces sp. NBC_01186]WSS43725.1 ABC transporter permease [Streptomyces sp. NBC_01187]